MNILVASLYYNAWCRLSLAPAAVALCNVCDIVIMA